VRQEYNTALLMLNIVIINNMIHACNDANGT